MKVVVTALKAPWPAGAGIGSVVEIPGEVPAWAVGKCARAADDAEATHSLEAPEFVVNPAADPDAKPTKAKAK